MKTSKTFSVFFWLKKSAKKKNGKSPIYARITVNGIRANVSLKRAVEEHQWCASSGRVISRVKGANSLNNYLDEAYSDILECHRQLKAEKKYVSAKAVKARYTGADDSSKTLKDLFKYHREVETLKLKRGTVKNYSSTERYLLSYIQKHYTTSDIFLAQIDYAFVSGFDGYLRIAPPLLKSKPLGNNGIMKHMERFHKMLNIALNLEWMAKDPFSRYRLHFKKYERPFLTLTELSAIETISLKQEGLQKVRDIFIFACYTGLCYADVKNLKPENITLGMDGDEWIFTKREKSNTSVKIPLLEKAKGVILKYSNSVYVKNRDMVLPVFSNQKCNTYLKKIVGKCNIDKKISFHSARHTFATTVTLANGVPIETVSKLLGHRKLSTTQIYARVMEKKISEDMAALRTKLNSFHSANANLDTRIA